jgi:hypothetical protein
VPPIIGTTEFIKNRNERIPKISAFALTAVLIDKIETKPAEMKEINDVITLFKVVITFDKLSSALSPEHMPIAKKQLLTGKKTFDDINDKPCAIINSIEFVEKLVVTPPPATTIAQNTGIKA